MNSISGHDVSATILIENGAKINIKDTNSSTPLHVAVFNGKFDSILIERFSRKEKKRNHAIHE